MAAFTRANTIGWAPGDPVTSAQMNTLDADHVKTMNVVDGDAEYNPAAVIQIGGAGFQWNGPTAFASTSVTTWEDGSACVWEDGSTCTWENGSLVTFGDGCLVTVELDCTIELFGGISVRSGGGTISFASGGVLNFQAGSTITGSASVASGATVTVASGGTLAAASGSTVNLAGTTTFTSSTNPQLSPARTWTRRCMRICNIDNTGMPSSPCAWVEGNAVSSPPFIRMKELTAGEFHWIELEDLPHAGTISQVQLKTQGAFTTATLTPATYRIIRWQGSAPIELMSDLVPDPHTTSNWSDALTFTLTVNAHSQIDRSYRYAVTAFHHQNVDDFADLFILDVVATGTVSSIQV